MPRCLAVACYTGCLVLALTIAAVAQETVDVAPPPSARFPAAWYPPENDVVSTMAPVKGAPYEARLVMNGGQPAAPLDHEPLYARDSAGRTRTETIENRMGADGKPIEVRAIEVNDAVTHCMFHWTEPWVEKSTPLATVSCMPRRLHYATQAMWSSVISMSTQLGEVHSSTVGTDYNESLGVRMFDGVRAIGVRHTRTYPGDSTARKIVTDLWVSSDMKEIVAMHSITDGFSFEYRDIKLREPDAKLFYPPPGYKIDSVANHP